MKIKNILGVLLLVIVILLVIVVIKTMTHPFSKHGDHPVVAQSTPKTVPEISLKRFAGGLSIPTISNQTHEETVLEPFDRFKVYLEESYPAVYSAMETQVINEYGLLFQWKGKNSSAKPILFLSHYDVVPVANYDPATADSTEVVYRPNDPVKAPIDTIQTSWDFPPFSGAVANGRIYGRGSLDMKCMLFSIMEAADALVAEGFEPAQDIWFAFGQDEEVGGLHGATKIAQYFKEHGITFDAVYDEGGIIAAPGSALKDVDRPLGLVGLGEKGFLTLEITVYGLGGHSSMPPAKSSLVYAAEIIEKLNNNQMPARLIPPIESFLNEIGGYMKTPARSAIANQWLLKPVLLKTLAKTPASNALIRTTTAISMAKGSEAANVLNTEATVTVNFRILQGESVQDVINHVKGLCKDYHTDLKIINSREPSGISPENSRGFEMIREAAATIYPEAIISSYITIGGTDAYKYQIVSDNIYRFMPLYLNDNEQRLLHNDNEYITINNFGKMIQYFRYIMEKY